MSPHLCLLLVALHVLTAAATQPSKTCSRGGALDVVVDGWPILVALRVPVLASVTMNLSLSHNHEEHTHLTLTHKSQNGTVVMTEATLKTQMAINDLNMAALLPDSTWATLKIMARHKELELKVNSEIHSTKYSSSALLATTHHIHVSKVTCSSPKCNSFIDLQCLYSKRNHTKEQKTSPQKRNPDKGVYYWGFYVVMLLLVVVCLLFLVWRNERNKFRMRWLRHSQTVRSITSNLDQVENPDQVSGRSEMVECPPGTSAGHSNPGYEDTEDVSLDRRPITYAPTSAEP